MPARFRRIGVLAGLCFLVAWRVPTTVESGHLPQQPDRLQRLAAEAKRKGQTSATFSLAGDNSGVGTNPAEIFNYFSFVVARPLDREPITTADNGRINSWVAVEVTRTVSLVARESTACVRDSAPSALRLAGPQEHGVSMSGGTYVVDGITITQTGYDVEPRLEPGSQYLLMVVACPGKVMMLPYEGLSVFKVGQDGRLSTDHGLRRPFIDAILSLGTVDAVAAYLKKR